MIYFFQHEEDKYIKIGHTGNLSVRYAQLTNQYGVLQLLGVCEGDKQREKELHKQFADCNRFGEWFIPKSELLDFIGKHTTLPITPYKHRQPKTGMNGNASFYLGSGEVKDRRVDALDRLAKQYGLSRSGLVQSIADGLLIPYMPKS